MNQEWQESGEEHSTNAQRRLLNAEQVRALLSYDPETGTLRWKKFMSTRATIGKEAGLIQEGRYRRIGIYGRYYLAHRLAWLIIKGEWPEDEIDHVNGQCSDNRWCNLREATCRQNKLNTRHANRSGLIGAAWSSHKGMYRATIHTGQGVKFLGWFDKAQDAHLAYVAAALEHHGEFAKCR